mmetsp:Transcript_4449/g.7885  ORF Transcript_4449/g.7885 Transcript_4449/m.7885 type:complete len:887 (-) Transcript_4449:965-3625(-)
MTVEQDHPYSAVYSILFDPSSTRSLALSDADAVAGIGGMDLQMLQEEVQEWLEINLGVEIADLFEELQDGVLLCRLVEKCGFRIKYRANARRMGIFHMRDNVSIFIRACTREMEVPDTVMFVPDDVVEQLNPTRVCVSLLYLARDFIRYGLKPPKIVQMEMEIVALEEQQQGANEPADAAGHEEEESHEESAEEVSGGEESDEQQPQEEAEPFPKKANWVEHELERRETVLPKPEPLPAYSPPKAEAPARTPAPPEPDVEPAIGPKAPWPEAASSQTFNPAKRLPVAPVHAGPANLREMMIAELLAAGLRQVTFEHVGNSQYIFRDSFLNRTGKVYVRELRGRTMVRVGGGWMSFLKFVITKFSDAADVDVNCKNGEVCKIEPQAEHVVHARAERSKPLPVELDDAAFDMLPAASPGLTSPSPARGKAGPGPAPSYDSISRSLCWELDEAAPSAAKTPPRLFAGSSVSTPRSARSLNTPPGPHTTASTPTKRTTPLHTTPTKRPLGPNAKWPPGPATLGPPTPSRAPASRMPANAAAAAARATQRTPPNRAAGDRPSPAPSPAGARAGYTGRGDRSGPQTPGKAASPFKLPQEGPSRVTQRSPGLRPSPLSSPTQATVVKPDPLARGARPTSPFTLGTRSTPSGLLAHPTPHQPLRSLDPAAAAPCLAYGKTHAPWQTEAPSVQPSATAAAPQAVPEPKPGPFPKPKPRWNSSPNPNPRPSPSITSPRRPVAAPARVPPLTSDPAPSVSPDPPAEHASDPGQNTNLGPAPVPSPTEPSPDLTLLEAVATCSADDLAPQASAGTSPKYSLQPPANSPEVADLGAGNVSKRLLNELNVNAVSPIRQGYGTPVKEGGYAAQYLKQKSPSGSSPAAGPPKSRYSSGRLTH